MFTDADMDRADWRLLQEGAVSLFWKPQVLDATKDDLKQLGYEILDIECGHGVEHFRAQVSLALRWEEQFGYSPWTGNLDALNDALREYPAPASGRSALALLGFHALAAVDGDFAFRTLDLIECAARRRLLLGDLLVCLVQTNDNRFTCPPLGGRAPSWNPREWLNSDRGLG
jgi:hypothetical protein